MPGIKMICADCGIEMNHHADKVDYSPGGEIDSEFGGVIAEMHSCPGCGKTAERIAR